MWNAYPQTSREVCSVCLPHLGALACWRPARAGLRLYGACLHARVHGAYFGAPPPNAECLYYTYTCTYMYYIITMYDLTHDDTCGTCYVTGHGRSETETDYRLKITYYIY